MFFMKASVPCPECGNDDVDMLVWDDPAGEDGFLTCWLCATRYKPLTGEVQLPS